MTRPQRNAKVSSSIRTCPRYRIPLNSEIHQLYILSSLPHRREQGSRPEISIPACSCLLTNYLFSSSCRLRSSSRDCKTCKSRMSTGPLCSDRIETYQRLLKVILDLITQDMRSLSVVCGDLCSDRNQDGVNRLQDKAGRSSRTRNASQATSWLNGLLDFCENGSGSRPIALTVGWGWILYSSLADMVDV